MRQADIMLASEGDAWYARNREQLGVRDPVSEMIKIADISPKRVLEVGCSNGWRLAALRDQYACQIVGIEPGRQAVNEAAELAVPAYLATADSIPAFDLEFDLVIYGFCLYLTEPCDWFRIVVEGDRVLKPGGHLIIHDFAETGAPFARRYKHHDGMLSYHVDFAKLWLGNPLYTIAARRIYTSDDMVTVLQKKPVDTIEVRT